MNPNTGQIYFPEDMKKMSEEMSKEKYNEMLSGLIPVHKEDMTDKQKKEKRVSLQDNSSVLGKKRVNVMNGLRKKNKAKRRAAKKSRQRNR